MTAAVPRHIAIAHFKAQISQIEHKQLALTSALASLNSACKDFSDFMRAPNLLNAALLASGLQKMVDAQLFGMNLEIKFVHQTLQDIKDQLAMAESAIINPGATTLTRHPGQS